MTSRAAFDAAFARCPLIAILRGVQPDEVEDIGEELVAAGFTLIEVPMNSPDPLDSIARLAKRFAGRAQVGAGTVLDASTVEAVAGAGGTLVIAPNADPRVIGSAAERGLVPIPGISTPTEAFAALEAGAAALKLFPAEAYQPVVVKAMLAVLPVGTRILPVGGIAPDTMAPWRAAGAAGFGLGSALFKPGMQANEVRVRADAFVAALG
jgi:2-dehydro-3-deoxyphosphogalactonate aldolase